MKQNTLILIIALSSFLFSCKDNSPVIEDLSGTKITVDSFNDAFDTAIESLSRMQNIEKKNLLEFISKDINEVPEQFRGLNQQFQKKNFYETYRQMVMTRIVAEKSGFTSQPHIKAILDQMQTQAINTLYIQEQVEKKIKITDEEAKAECEYIRSQSREAAALPVDRCLLIGRGRLKQARSQDILPKVMERIKEGVVIKHNEKFDLDAFLNDKNIPSKETPTDSTPE